MILIVDELNNLIFTNEEDPLKIFLMYSTLETMQNEVFNNIYAYYYRCKTGYKIVSIGKADFNYLEKKLDNYLLNPKSVFSL